MTTRAHCEDRLEDENAASCTSSHSPVHVSDEVDAFPGSRDDYLSALPIDSGGNLSRAVGSHIVLLSRDVSNPSRKKPGAVQSLI